MGGSDLVLVLFVGTGEWMALSAGSRCGSTTGRDSRSPSAVSGYGITTDTEAKSELPP